MWGEGGGGGSQLTARPLCACAQPVVSAVETLAALGFGGNKEKVLRGFGFWALRALIGLLGLLGFLGFLWGS